MSHTILNRFNRNDILLRCISGLILFFISFDSFSVVISESSRIVYNLNNKEQSLQVYNLNEYPVLVQLWIDDRDEDSLPDKATDSPIIPLPAIFKLKEKESKSIRLIKTKDSFLDNKEILYWLTIYEVPPLPKDVKYSDDTSVLMLTVRTKIKVFLRPAELFKEASEVINKLNFTWENNTLTLINSSPFYITVSELRIPKSSNGDSIYNGMLEPFSQVVMQLENKGNQERLILTYIDDDGAYRTVEIYSSNLS